MLAPAWCIWPLPEVTARDGIRLLAFHMPLFSKFSPFKKTKTQTCTLERVSSAISTSSADLIAYMHRTEKARSIPRSLDPTSTLFCDHFQPWKSRVEAVSSADSANFCAAWLHARENGTPPYALWVHTAHFMGRCFSQWTIKNFLKSRPLSFRLFCKIWTARSFQCFTLTTFRASLCMSMCHEMQNRPMVGAQYDGTALLCRNLPFFASPKGALSSQGHLALEEAKNSPAEDLWHDNLSQDLSILKGWELQAMSPQSSIAHNPLVEQHLPHCFGLALARVSPSVQVTVLHNSWVRRFWNGRNGKERTWANEETLSTLVEIPVQSPGSFLPFGFQKVALELSIKLYLNHDYTSPSWYYCRPAAPSSKDFLEYYRPGDEAAMSRCRTIISILHYSRHCCSLFSAMQLLCTS